LAGGLAAFNVDLLMLLDNNIPVPRNIRSITIDVLSKRDTLLSITINAQLVSTETGAQVWADRLEGERKLGQTALRLSPHDDQASSWQLRLCYLHNLLAQWEQGIEWCEKAVVNNHDQWYGQALAALA
jgi:hypothetical protein